MSAFYLCLLFIIWNVYSSHLGMTKYKQTKIDLQIALDAVKSKFNMCHICDSILTPSGWNAKMFQFLNLILLHQQEEEEGRVFDVRIPRTPPAMEERGHEFLFFAKKSQTGIWFEYISCSQKNCHG